MMKFGLLKYDSQGNLVDEIQSLAVRRFLPRVDAYFDRDGLAQVRVDEPHFLFLNGWFSGSPENSLPAAENILPAFVGFHVTRSNASAEVFSSPAVVSYLNYHAPVGARDHGTLEMLSKLGVDSYLSRCPTLTFEKRCTTPENGKVILVDVDKIYVPEAIARHAISVKQETERIFSCQTKFRMAEELLQLYREKARLVITSRLHCALPCLAMGIPVVFLGDPSNYRLRLVQDVGLKINTIHKIRKRGVRVFTTNALSRYKMRDIDWDPAPVDIDAHKAAVEKTIRESMQRWC